jgi:hypothetical protein
VKGLGISGFPTKLKEEEIIWNFDNVQKAYATRGYEANQQN